MDHAPERLALIEVEGRDGRIGRAVDVLRWPLTLGRALDNHLVVATEAPAHVDAD